MSYLIYLNGRQLQSDEYSGAQGATFTVRQADSSGEAAFSFSATIAFSGQAANELRAAIIEAANPFAASIGVEVHDDCCDTLIFKGRITHQSVSWCEVSPNGSCVVEASISEDTSQSAALACLKSTVISSTKSIDGRITSQGPDEFRGSLYFDYCTEARPASFQYTLVVIAATYLLTTGILLYLLSTVARPVRDALNRLQDRLLGCGKKIKAPFVHSYLANACKLCGLGLDAPLFNPSGFLHNLVRVDMPYKGDARTRLGADEQYFVFNRPSLTVAEFLDTFKPFNIEWLLDGNTLRIDRKDRIAGGLIADLTTRESDIIRLCFSVEDKQLWAGRYYRWPNDQSDKVANQLAQEYSGLIDYNKPVFNPVLSGVQTIDLGYGFLIQNNTYLAESTYNELQNVGVVTAAFNVPTDSIIAQTETRGYPALGIWDGGSLSDPKIDAYPFKLMDTSVVPPPFVVTTPSGPITFPSPTLRPNLYSELLAIDEPRNNPPRLFPFELEFMYQCDDLNAVRGKTVRFTKGGNVVTGYVEQVEINPNSRTMTITGKC